jgi:hypothetical protein
MNARQRRLPCPLHIPAPPKELRELANARREDVFRLVFQAIGKQGSKGRGSWSVARHGRFGITVEWTGKGSDVGHKENSQKPWEQFGGNEIVRAAGYSPELPLMEGAYIEEGRDQWIFYKILPTCD